MSSITITIKTDNAAFREATDGMLDLAEVRAVLDSAYAKIAGGYTEDGYTGVAFDTNGNRVAQIVVDES